MLDLGFVRANLFLVEEKLRARGQNPVAVLGDFRALDAERRERITSAEQLKASRNRLSVEIAGLKKAGQADAANALMEQVRAQKQESEALESAAAAAEDELRSLLAKLPNLPDATVPPGSSELENQEVKRWSPSGIDPEQDHLGLHLLPHWELGESLGILDLERAAKLSGARFAVYWGEGARLERALAQFMLDMQTREHGYLEVQPPVLVNSRSLFGTGQLPKFEEDLFRCAGETGENEHWLIPTAEVPLVNLFRDEILDEADLPLSLAACTPCFRSEAGSYGRDVRGIIRNHQFQKVELVKFARPDESEAEHERLTVHAEAVLERLGLPYRRMLLCAGDMGFSAMKTYDLEVWLPGQGLYREISSCSNCGDFQARRANIRYRPAGKAKAEHLHTLNGSGLAVGRTWVAVVENYQQPDGTVRVPEALLPYMGRDHGAGATLWSGAHAGQIGNGEVSMGILGNYIFWKYERGSLHYDVMVTLILAFIFVSPHVINYHDHPVADNLSPSTVLVRPTTTGLVYEIPADQVHTGTGVMAGQLDEPLAEAIAPISGVVKVDRYDRLTDASGKVTAYKVWAHR